MKRRNTKRKLRNASVKAEFKQMTDVKKLRTNHVVKLLADKYFVTEKTIEQIVYEIGHYKESTIPQPGQQLSFF
jgi:hypothetical protein